MTCTNDMINLNELLDTKINKLLDRQTNNQKKTILVLSGGGIKGISHIGALKAMEEKGILEHIKTIAGTSVGGLVGGLYIIGYKPDELYKFIELFDPKKVRSINMSDFFTKFGIDDAKKFTFVLEKLFESKNIPTKITFKELYNLTKIKLILVATCLNDKQAHYLSYLSYPDMPVLLGLTITACVPFWFAPIVYNGKLFVDGGCIDNYPIQLFKSELDSVLGIYLAENKAYSHKISNVEEFICELLQCFSEGVTCNSVKGFEKCTIKMEVQQISLVSLNIDTETKKKLFICGRETMMTYLSGKI